MDTEDRRAERALKDVNEEISRDEVEISPDREKSFGSGLFARMRTDWRAEDRDMIHLVRQQAELDIHREFRDAYSVLMDVYLTYRKPKVDHNGEIVLNEHGLEPEWERDSFGRIIEDWIKITDRDREKFILNISMLLVDLKQRTANLWGESQLAKAKWEDSFVEGFLKAKGTNDARTNDGKASAREDRYFAIYKSWVSRKADSLVSSLELLCQRLKDTNF